MKIERTVYLPDVGGSGHLQSDTKGRQAQRGSVQLRTSGASGVGDTLQGPALTWSMEMCICRPTQLTGEPAAFSCVMSWITFLALADE